jgi:membrane dipeptidase
MEATGKSFLEIHREVLVVDGHSDIFTDIAHRRQRGERGVLRARHLRVLQDGGVDVVMAAAYIEPEYKPERSLKRAMQILGAALADLDETPDIAMIIRSRNDFQRVITEGKLGLLLGLEGGEPVEDNLGSLRSFYEIGVRFIGLTWNQRNRLADGVDEERSKGGLTRAGVDVVREANRLGMVIDVSHISQAGFWDVLATSSTPIMASHSSSRCLRDHPRNLTDDQIKAVAGKGGVVGVCFAGAHLSGSKSTVETIADHVEHMVHLVGPSHVGLGPDFVSYLYEGGALPAPVGGHQPVEGMEDASKLPQITKVLLRRGLSEGDITQVLGGSFTRLFEQVLH